jgi:methionine-rich copper-binding protein CopC
MRTSRLPFAAAVAAVLVASPFALRAVPLPHLKLKASFPAADTTLAQAPKQVELWFSEAPEMPVSKIGLAADGGAEVAVGELARGKDANSPSLVVPVTGKMSAGKYTVTWRAGSKDGHPVNGTYSFTLAK